jgi:hypothetical protein
MNVTASEVWKIARNGLKNIDVLRIAVDLTAMWSAYFRPE